MLTIVILALVATIVATMLATIASKIRAPRGKAAPDGGPLPVSNVYGGLRDDEREHGAETIVPRNIPLTPWAPGMEVGSRVGDCNACGGGNPNGIGNAIPDCSAVLKPMAPVKRWMLAAVISAADLAAGSTKNIPLKGIPLRDSAGRIAHVIGFRFNGTYDFKTTNTTNTAISGYDSLFVWNNIWLKDASGHTYIGGLTARDLWDDGYLRSLRYNSSLNPIPGGLAANVGTAQSNLKSVAFNYSFVRPYAKPHEQMMDAIPLALIQAAGDDAFRFTSANTLAGSPTNVTANGFSGNTEIWLHIAYLPGVMADNPWQIRTYQDSNLQGNLQNCDEMYEYACVRHYPEETGGSGTGDYDGVTVQMSGDVLMAALTLAQWNERINLTYFNDPLWQDASPTVIVSSGQRFGLLLGPSPAGRSNLPTGVLSWQFTTRSTHTNTRFFQRTYAVHNAERLAMAQKIANPLDPTNVHLIGIGNGGEGQQATHTRPILVTKPVKK